MRAVDLKGDSGSLKITVLSYERTNPESSSDANWLNCRIDIDIFPFSGTIKIPLCTTDFRNFLIQISSIIDGSIHEASFETDEGIFSFHLNLTQIGELEIDGLISTQSATLKFKSQSDQSYLQGIEQELIDIMESFPIK